MDPHSAMGMQKWILLLSLAQECIFILLFNHEGKEIPDDNAASFSPVIVAANFFHLYSFSHNVVNCILSSVWGNRAPFPFSLILLTRKTGAIIIKNEWKMQDNGLWHSFNGKRMFQRTMSGRTYVHLRGTRFFHSSCSLLSILIRTHFHEDNGWLQSYISPLTISA